MTIEVTFKPMGKPSQDISLPDGSTIADAMRKLAIDVARKQFTVRGDEGTGVEDSSYVLQDGDFVSVTTKNENG